MKFLIISHAALKKTPQGLYGYAPYIREMNLWFKHVREVNIISPLNLTPVSPIDMMLEHPKLKFTTVAAFSLTSPKEVVKTIFGLYSHLKIVYRAMKSADHIHLRCPGNMGLIGAIVQIVFPSKIKTAKYAGNWDWKSKQPWSYRFQQYVLRNTFLTKNISVLVYGEWPDRNKNILPFFTATYSEKNRIKIKKAKIEKGINLIYVGGLFSGKRPLLALQTLQLLLKENLRVNLTICGDGSERSLLEDFIVSHNLEKNTLLLGNVSGARVQKELQKAHFLLFASKSEGWPKVVAEAMWWGCIPITSAVSCVPQMVGEGLRGKLVEPNSDSMFTAILELINNEGCRKKMVANGIQWSHDFTLERLECEIKNLLKP